VVLVALSGMPAKPQAKLQ